MASLLPPDGGDGESLFDMGELRYDTGDGYASFNDDDDPTEVDAAFRSQRRIAVGHFAIFLLATLGAGAGLVSLDWAAEASIFGGFTPGFAVAGFGLYVVFVVIGAAATSLANGVEDRMLGARSLGRNQVSVVASVGDRGD